MSFENIYGFLRQGYETFSKSLINDGLNIVYKSNKMMRLLIKQYNRNRETEIESMEEYILRMVKEKSATHNRDN